MLSLKVIVYYMYSAINRDVALCPGSNIKTKTFWVHAENCYNRRLRHASVLGGCSKNIL